MTHERDITYSINRTLRSLGDKFSSAERTGGDWIQGSYRTWRLPKYFDEDLMDEYEYEEKLEKEFTKANEALDKALAPFQEHIKEIYVDQGDKNWVEVSVRLA